MTYNKKIGFETKYGGLEPPFSERSGTALKYDEKAEMWTEIDGTPTELKVEVFIQGHRFYDVCQKYMIHLFWPDEYGVVKFLAEGEGEKYESTSSGVEGALDDAYSQVLGWAIQSDLSWRGRLPAYEPPVGEIEQRVTLICQEIFGGEQIGRNDDFYEFGFDSLSAIELYARCREIFDVKLEFGPPLCEATTVAKLSNLIERAPERGGDA